MVIVSRTMSVQEFDKFVDQTDNLDRLFEFIGGEIVEVPSNPFVSKLSARMIGRLQLHMDEHDDPGHVTGEAGGYMVSGERYAPDVAYISKMRQPELAKTGYNPNPPELAVEIVSPTDDPDKLMIKIGNYLAAGTLVWVVYPPPKKQVAVYEPGQPVRLLNEQDTLELPDLLPGFTLPVSYIFKA
jgi:Uma2 family endonuclease